METTIGKLRVGAPLAMGMYGVNRDRDPAPIIWLKGTTDNDFIAEFALDYLAFDASEWDNENRMAKAYGNSNYSRSNLLQFLNSDRDIWYEPTHVRDNSPNWRSVEGEGYYDEHYGFLHLFEEYELNSIQPVAYESDGEQVVKKIRLPYYENFVGENRFALFRKKGFRAKGSVDLLLNKPHVRIDPNSYIEVWLANHCEDDWSAAIMGRNGLLSTTRPRASKGVRPVCTIDSNTVVFEGTDGIYHIKPYISGYVCTDEELFEFLGVTPF